MSDRSERIKEYRASITARIAEIAGNKALSLPGAKRFLAFLRTNKVREEHRHLGTDVETEAREDHWVTVDFCLMLEAARAEGRVKAEAEYGLRLEVAEAAGRGLRAELEGVAGAHQRYVQEVAAGKTKMLRSMVDGGLGMDVVYANMDRVPTDALREILDAREQVEDEKLELEDWHVMKAEAYFANQLFDLERAAKARVPGEVAELRQIKENVSAWVMGKYGVAGLYEVDATERSIARHKRNVAKRGYTISRAKVGGSEASARREFMQDAGHVAGGGIAGSGGFGLDKERPTKLDMGEGYGPEKDVGPLSPQQIAYAAVENGRGPIKSLRDVHHMGKPLRSVAQIASSQAIPE